MTSPSATRQPLLIALAYVFFASAWITLSDRVLEQFFPDPRSLVVAGTYKGLAFVAVTSLLLYLVLLRRETQQRDARDDLQRSQARFRATFDQAAVGIAHVGLDGRWLRVNQKLCEIVGHSRDELLRIHFQDITHPDDLDHDLAHMHRLLRDEISHYRIEKRYLHKAGHTVWIALTVALVRRKDHTPDYFISVVEDISLRRQAEEQLQRSEAAYHELFAANPHPMWVFDLETLAFLDVNAAAIHHYGFSREEFLAMTILDIRSPADAERVRGSVVGTPPGFANQGIWQHRRKDGSAILVEIRSHPLQFAGRRAKAVQAHDITAQRQAEEALQDAMARLRTLSESLIDVQENERRRVSRELHDEVGQSFTAIKIMLQTLQRTQAGGLPQLGDAIAIADRALEQVRDLSRMLRPSHLDDLGLAPALHSLCERIARSSGINVHLLADDATERLPGPLETTGFRVVQEALTNVMRHAGATYVEVSLRPEAKGVRLVVRDDGRGFAADAALATVGRNSQGLIGMQERARLAGGRLAIRSAPGAGTTVELWLPRELPA